MYHFYLPGCTLTPSGSWGGGTAIPCCATSTFLHIPSHQVWWYEWLNLETKNSYHPPKSASAHVPLVWDSPKTFLVTYGRTGIEAVFLWCINKPFIHQTSSLLFSGNSIKTFKPRQGAVEISTKTWEAYIITIHTHARHRVRSHPLKDLRRNPRVLKKESKPIRQISPHLRV